MTDNLSELLNAFDLAVRGSRRRGRLPGRLGYQDSSGAWVFSVPGWPGYTYVRLGLNEDGESVTLTKAINHAVGEIPDLPVWVERNEEGLFVITGVRTAEFLAMTSGTRTGATVAPHTHEPGGGMVDPVSDRRIVPGLVYATGSGLLLGARPFAYRYAGVDKKFQGGTINIAAHLPSSGYWRWVKVCLDPNANSLVALAGDPVSVNTVLTDAMLDGILATDLIPLAGIKLKAGAATLDESLIVDRRPWWSVVAADAFQGSSILWNADQFPASPSAEDDEFNDNLLAAKWTEYDSSAIQSVSESGSTVVLSQGTQASEVLTGLYQPLPAGDFTLAAKVSVNAGSPSGSGISWQVGLALWENAASAAAAAILVGPYADYAGGASRRLFAWSRFTANNAFESSLADNLADAWSQSQFVYVRIRRSGTTYYADFSQDGESWRTLQVYPEFTPQHCGLALFNKASGQTITCTADFFRRRAQADSNLDPVFGGVYLETTRLTELGDVDLETIAPANGNVLLFDGTKWIAGEGGSAKPLLLWTFAGNLGVGASPLRIYNTAANGFQIQKVFLSVNTPPTGASVIVDVHKNGTTIFTTQANRPQVAEGQYTGQSTAIDVTSWGVGEYLTVEVDQVGPTVPGANLTVQVIVSEIAGGGGGSGSDTTAIHTNTANEIASLTEKVTPVSSDLLVIEDSAASNAKKKVQIGNLPLGAGSLDDLSDVDLTTTPPVNGDVLTYNSAGGIWKPGAGGGGASSFLGLTDTPNSYTGQAGKVVVVGATETGVEFTDTVDINNLYGEQIIGDVTLAANGNFDFQNLPQTYDHIKVYAFLRRPSGTSYSSRLYFNNDTTDGNYRVSYHTYGTDHLSNNLDNAELLPTPDATYLTGIWSKHYIDIPFYAAAGHYKYAYHNSYHINLNAGPTNAWNQGRPQSMVWKQTSAISRITLTCGTGGFLAGSRVIVTGVGRLSAAIAAGNRDLGARVRRSTNQTISNATMTAISFDTERWDTDTIWDAGQPTRLTCKTAGAYLITGHVCWDNNTGGTYRLATIRLNGTTELARQAGVLSAYGEASVSTIYKLAVNDYVELCVYQDSGGDRTLEAIQAWSPEFAMQLLARS